MDASLWGSVESEAARARALTYLDDNGIVVRLPDIGAMFGLSIEEVSVIRDELKPVSNLVEVYSPELNQWFEMHSVEEL
jgi:hypothetical protein